MSRTRDRAGPLAAPTALDPGQLALLMRLFDETASDVLRIVDMVFHRGVSGADSTPTPVVVATYVAVATRIQSHGGGEPDRSWVISTAHSLARQAIRPARAPALNRTVA